jgi:hypothetical protein
VAGVLLLALALASYGGFALLALSQDRHWERVGGARCCPERLARPMQLAGGILLVTSLFLSLWRDGPGFGALLWATMLSVGAVVVTCTLTWRAHWLRPVVRTLQGIA